MGGQTPRHAVPRKLLPAARGMAILAMSCSVAATQAAGPATDWPHLARLDACIDGAVRQSVQGRRSPLSESAKEQAAEVALARCDHLVDAATQDYKKLTTRLLGRAPDATPAQWRAKVISLRLSMARGIAVLAAPRPTPLDSR